MLSEEEIRHIARIARIELTDEEVRMFREQFAHIFELLERLNNLPLAEEERFVSTENVNEFREDVPSPFSDPDAILRNAPRRKERYVRVPKNL